MGVNFEVEYHELVVKEDIPKLTKTEKEKVRRAIEEKLMTRPELFGKNLRNSLNNYRALRVGDYRVIYRILKNVVKVMLIQHRSVVYKLAGKRIS